MIAELGYFLLILNLFINILNLIVFFTGRYFNYKDFSIKFILLSSVIKFIFITLSFSFLIYSFYISDFSVLLVSRYSSSIKPILYKIVASWGNHEGSMLLWLWLFSGVNFIYSISKLENYEKKQVLVIQSIIEIFFLGFLINYSNPFIKINAPSEGEGLNPLLQDIGLALHPPILYLGYVLLSISFSTSIAALIRGFLYSTTVKVISLWNNLSWILISTGIMLGSWWAYRELGWGGFWFWDPVENISLMPWLICTALIHTQILVIRNDVFKEWFIFLSLLGFCLSLVGSFLVRSGILISVHSFANDQTRGKYLLIILAIISSSSLLLFLLFINKFSKKYSFKLDNIETIILTNNILFITASFTILIGTLYPIFYKFLGSGITVGEGYFINSFLPIFLFILLFMSVTKNNIKFTKTIIIEFVSSNIITLYIAYHSKDFSVKYLLFLLSSIFLIISMLNMFINNIREKISNQYGMIISHLFVGIIAFSITINNYNKLEDSLYLKLEDQVNIGAYKIVLKSIEYDKGNNYYIRRAKFLIADKNKELDYLFPEFRFYNIEDTTSYESAIYHSILGDLYIVIGEMKDSQLAVRIYYKPMMNYIWFSVLLIALTGIINLFKKRKYGKDAFLA